MSRRLILTLHLSDDAGRPIDGRHPQTLYIGRSQATLSAVRQAAIAAGTLAGAKVHDVGCSYLPYGEVLTHLTLVTQEED